MAIFNSYVKLPEGKTPHHIDHLSAVDLQIIHDPSMTEKESHRSSRQFSNPGVPVRTRRHATDETGFKSSKMVKKTSVQPQLQPRSSLRSNINEEMNQMKTL
jgi:hypothetical protein